MAKYVSEFDQWLRRFKERYPETESLQREGRARLWDKPPDQVDRPKSHIINRQHSYTYYPVKDYTNK